MMTFLHQDKFGPGPVNPASYGHVDIFGAEAYCLPMKQVKRTLSLLEKGEKVRV